MLLDMTSGEEHIFFQLCKHGVRGSVMHIEKGFRIYVLLNQLDQFSQNLQSEYPAILQLL